LRQSGAGCKPAAGFNPPGRLLAKVAQRDSLRGCLRAVFGSDPSASCSAPEYARMDDDLKLRVAHEYHPIEGSRDNYRG